MGNNIDTLALRRGAETLLRDLIHERAGLYYADDKMETLNDKITPLIHERGFSSFLDYYYLLKFDANAGAEWDKVSNALSVQETYFWREMDQIEELADRVLPDLARKLDRDPIQIWSAACATGEEPLTIAMRLNEDGWFDRANIEIHASDASSYAIGRARQGRFRERAFRTLPGYLKQKYFHPDGKEWSVDRSIHEKIKWHQVNLMDTAAIEPLAAASVIFCRNVFIYFSQESIRKVVDTFARTMPVPAYLFTGASESLLKVTDDFELEEIGTCFAYVKRD